MLRSTTPNAISIHANSRRLGNTPSVAHKHYLTVTDEHFAAASKTGDKLGMQTLAAPRNDSHKKTRTVHEVRENACFSEVVGIWKMPE